MLFYKNYKLFHRGKTYMMIYCVSANYTIK